MRLSLGKLLFPRIPEDQRRHQMHILWLSFVVALIISGVIIIVMLMSDQMTEHWLARL
jgi:hypothetical protein